MHDALSIYIYISLVNELGTDTSEEEHRSVEEAADPAHDIDPGAVSPFDPNLPMSVQTTRSLLKMLDAWKKYFQTEGTRPSERLYDPRLKRLLAELASAMEQDEDSLAHRHRICLQSSSS